MKPLKIVGMTVLASALMAGTSALHAQETNEPAPASQPVSEVEQLKRQLQQMQENFARQQAEQQKQIEALSKQIEALSRQQTTQAAMTSAPPANVAGAPGAVTPEQFKRLDQKVDEVVAAQKKTLMSEFNPAIGLVGETIFSARSKGSDQTGSDRPGGLDVNQRSVELNVSASVDPFAKGYAVINGSADAATGETSLEVEEAALETTSLPWNLTLKAGQFFGEFGRLAYIHDHELPFVNRPLVLDQYIGGESKTAGAQVSWLAPIEHYVNFTAGFGDQFGDTPNDVGTYRTLSKVNYFGRLSTYFDLAPNWELETGVSGLINPNTGDLGGAQVQPNGISTLTEKERRLVGADVKLSWLPLRNNQFNSVTWGTEVLYSDNQYLANPDGIPNNGDEFDDTVGSWGMYSYLTYKWSRSWSAGFLFEFLQSDQNSSEQTYAYSPYLTWAISHWNQLRLQYTHTQPNAATGYQPDDAVYLQWSWIIGAHSHGWQSR